MYFERCRGPSVASFSRDYYSIKMFSKRKASANQNAKFYEVPANMEEVQSGYMYKSPPQAFFRSLKSWKRRFFVLSKTSASYYQLKFFKDENKREKPLGQINLYRILLLIRTVESHPHWLWIQRNFRCVLPCVLYMRVSEREYFLIGENSSEMDSWFSAIYEALNAHPITLTEETKKNRSQSDPVVSVSNLDLQQEDQEQEDPKPSPLLMRQSAPESFNSQYSHYDYPKNYMKTQSLESDDTEEDEEDEMKTNQKNDTGYYMDMGSVKEVLKQTEHEDVLFPQTSLAGNNVSEKSFLQTGNKGSDSTALNWQVSSESETIIPVEKEICVTQDELKNSVIFSEEAGRVCVSNRKHTQSSCPLHEGDQILAINDLLTDSLEELQRYLKRLSKDQVKLTILRQPRSQPLSGFYT